MRPLVLVVVALLLGACSAVPTASSVPAAPSSTPSPTPGSLPPSSSPSPSLLGPASPTLPPTPPPTASPSTPVVGPAPSGPWTAVDWIPAATLPLGPTEVNVHGWSGGYVAFEQTGGSDD